MRRRRRRRTYPILIFQALVCAQTPQRAKTANPISIVSFQKHPAPSPQPPSLPWSARRLPAVLLCAVTCSDWCPRCGCRPGMCLAASGQLHLRETRRGTWAERGRRGCEGGARARWWLPEDCCGGAGAFPPSDVADDATIHAQAPKMLAEDLSICPKASPGAPLVAATCGDEILALLGRVRRALGEAGRARRAGHRGGRPPR